MTTLRMLRHTVSSHVTHHMDHTSPGRALQVSHGVAGDLASIGQASSLFDIVKEVKILQFSFKLRITDVQEGRRTGPRRLCVPFRLTLTRAGATAR
jgi:hypothetical protein